MSVWILEGTCDHGHCAALVDTVTGLAFGPTFSVRAEAEAFLEWLGSDPRLAVDLPSKVAEWRSSRGPVATNTLEPYDDPHTGERLYRPRAAAKERWGIVRNPGAPAHHREVWLTRKGGGLWECSTEAEAKQKIESILRDEPASGEVRDRLRSCYQARRLKSTDEVFADTRAKVEADHRQRAVAMLLHHVPTKALARAELLANLAMFEKNPERLPAVAPDLFAALREYFTADATFDDGVSKILEGGHA